MYLGAYGSFSAWYGTESWGPRYLLPLIPFLVLPLGYVLEEKGSSIKLILSVLVVLSVFQQLSPVLVSPGRFFNRVRRMERESGERVDTIYSLRNAEWVLHWYDVADVLTGDSGFSRNEIGFSADDPVDFGLHELVNSTLNFWWVYMVHLGIPLFLVIPMIGLGIIGTGLGLMLIIGNDVD
jgi:hypothetical protein